MYNDPAAAGPNQDLPIHRLYPPARGTHRSRRAAPLCVAAVLMLLVAGGCNGDGTGIGQPPRITITPSDPVSLFIGDTVRVTATIRNTPYTGVSYSSSAPQIVSVEPAGGLATAVAPGDAIVTGVSQIDPRIFAEARVTVLPDQPTSLQLEAIGPAGGGEWNASAVRGEIVATYEVAAGNATRMEVLLRGVVVCEEAFTPSVSGAPSPQAIDCAVDTGAFEVADGSARFRNGEALLEARLLGSGERVLAALPGVPLVLANSSRLAASVSTERNAVDSSGNAWTSGEVIVQVVPVLYQDEGEVQSVTFEYRTPAGQDTTATAATSPFSFSLPRDGLLTSVTDPALTLRLTSTLEQGDTGPSGWTEPVRYDAAAPHPGALVPRAWIGADTRFVDSYDPATEKDEGVGRVHVRFYAGDPALTAGAIASTGTQVNSGGDLPQAGPGSYRLVGQVCDGLENCTLVDGYEFGVDLTPPLVESVSIRDRAANPGADLLLGVRDDLSGFPERLLEATVELLDASPATAFCGPTVESVDLPGRPIAGGCAPDTVANPVPVPRTTAGYYRYSVVAFDRAGNRSSTVMRTVLVDLEPPSIGALELSTPLEPGAQMTASASTDDDVELLSVSFRLVYSSADTGTSVALPFAPALAAGVPFDATLTTSFSASGPLPFVRTLTLASAAVGTRPTLLVDSIRGTVRDVANLSASSSRAILPAEYGNDTDVADPFPRFSTAVVTLDRASLCAGGCTSSDPTTLRISARVEGESGTGRPFARIHFYRRDAAGLLTHIGSLDGTETTITNVGNRSSYLYTLEYDPEASAAGDYGIVAVGVNSRGNALATSLDSAPSVTFYLR